MRYSLIISLILILNLGAASQTIKVRSAGTGKARIISGKVQSIVDLSDDIAGCLSLYDGSVSFTKRIDVTEFRLLDSVRKGKNIYLLLHAPAGPNCNVQGYCGAAQNNTLIWLRLNAKLKVIKKQAVIVEDCQAQIDVIFPEREDDEDLQDLKLILFRGELKVISRKTIDFKTKESEITTIHYKHAEAENGLFVITEKWQDKAKEKDE